MTSQMSVANGEFWALALSADVFTRARGGDLLELTAPLTADRGGGIGFHGGEFRRLGRAGEAELTVDASFEDPTPPARDAGAPTSLVPTETPEQRSARQDKVKGSRIQLVDVEGVPMDSLKEKRRTPPYECDIKTPGAMCHVLDFVYPASIEVTSSPPPPETPSSFGFSFKATAEFCEDPEKKHFCACCYFKQFVRVINFTADGKDQPISSGFNDDCAWFKPGDASTKPLFIAKPPADPSVKIVCTGSQGSRTGEKHPSGEIYNGCHFEFTDRPLIVARNLELTVQFVGEVRDACLLNSLRAVDSFYVSLKVVDGVPELVASTTDSILDQTKSSGELPLGPPPAEAAPDSRPDEGK